MCPPLTRRPHSKGEDLVSAPPPRLDSASVHALSNYLAVILGFAELVISETAEDHPRYADLVEIRSAAIAASKLLGHDPVGDGRA